MSLDFFIISVNLLLSFFLLLFSFQYLESILNEHAFKNMKKALDKRDWKLAAVEGRDSLWYRQVSNRAERLMTRMENVTDR